MPASNDKISELSERAAKAETRLEEHDRSLSKKVSKDEFLPVKLIAYGIAGTALGGVLTKIIQVALQVSLK